MFTPEEGSVRPTRITLSLRSGARKKADELLSFESVTHSCLWTDTHCLFSVWINQTLPGCDSCPGKKIRKCTTLEVIKNWLNDRVQSGFLECSLKFMSVTQTELHSSFTEQLTGVSQRYLSMDIISIWRGLWCNGTLEWTRWYEPADNKGTYKYLKLFLLLHKCCLLKHEAVTSCSLC